jgi:hypothetical protein
MNILMLIKEAPEQTENKTPQKIVDSQIAKRGGGGGGGGEVLPLGERDSRVNKMLDDKWLMHYNLLPNKIFHGDI